MDLFTDEQLALLPSPGQKVVVRNSSGYMVRGLLIGLEQHIDGPLIRVLPEDKIERKVPLPCAVTLDA